MAVDLAAVLEHYGADVPSASGNRMVRCVFHEDRTPSMSVNLGKGLWNCKSCSRGGDGFNLIMEKEGVGYRESVEFAKTNLGLTADDADGDEGSVSGWLASTRGGGGKKASKGKTGKGWRPAFRR